jgi:hypothetical protein
MTLRMTNEKQLLANIKQFNKICTNFESFRHFISAVSHRWWVSVCVRGFTTSFVEPLNLQRNPAVFRFNRCLIRPTEYYLHPEKTVVKK